MFRFPVRPFSILILHEIKTLPDVPGPGCGIRSQPTCLRWATTFVPAQIAGMLQETGFAMDLTRVVGPIVLACTLLYAIPATSVLGAILVTGYLGGAICAHVRMGELGSPPEIISLFLGALTWAGLYARNSRIRALLPLVR
ncbi:MAG: DoxX family protein [Rhodanobacter sp.]|nr:MAG: DoxX family protein [Rhodanobacter sp.]